MPQKDRKAYLAYQRAYAKNDRVAAARRLREFRKRHLERVRAEARARAFADYHAKDKHDPAYMEKARAKAAAWYAANKPRALLTAKVHTTKRRKLVKHAMPAWANRFFIREIYDLAMRRTKATRIPWEVDHIIPLRGKNVCGLHVETNLRVVPKILNRGKGCSLPESDHAVHSSRNQ